MTRAPLSQVTTVFACPVCGEALPRVDRTFTCANGHAFDVAREGYVNLLLAQHRRSKDPGYSREMIKARRGLFDAGHYEPLADELADLIVAHLPGTSGQVVVDAGCGEGYYLRRLRARLGHPGGERPVTMCGIDLSRHAVRLAAKRDPQGLYAVAGTFRLPVLPGRADVVLSHFSPVSAPDFRRVVRPGGVVLVGGPGEHHLSGLKKELYRSPLGHKPSASLVGEPGFELIDSSRIRYEMHLRGPSEVADLLSMTPFYWSADEATQARLARLDSLDAEVDVVIHAYQRREGSPPAPPR